MQITSWKKHIGPASTIILAWTLIARRRLESHKCCWAAWIAIPTTESSDHTELLWDQFSCFIWATRFVDGKVADDKGRFFFDFVQEFFNSIRMHPTDSNNRQTTSGCVQIQDVMITTVKTELVQSTTWCVNMYVSCMRIHTSSSRASRGRKFQIWNAYSL